jgi:hypothetical protein
MKKLSWGTKLGIMASLYVVGVLMFVGFSTTQKINLVSKDYYPKEIQYESQIQKIKNAQQLAEPVLISQKNQNIQVQFPESMIKGVEGKIILYRPADYEKDLKVNIALNDSGVQEINSAQLLRGRYTIKLDWKHNNIPYYKEEAIYLQK